METKTCELCGMKSSNSDVDTFAFGKWIIRQKLTFHHYCLLLSTDLPQCGGDSCGILGFLMRDIREVAAAAKKKICCFCNKTGANIACHKCRKRFHWACSLNHNVTSEFCGEFHSYCEECTPFDGYQRQLLANPPENQNCGICSQVIQPFNLHRVSYGDCCRKGFAHRKCMRGYALTSGYNLRCIWCHSEKFRDIIRKQSIFVPDATCERQNNAYKELHRKHMLCAQETCLCPNGRDFNKNTWIICPCKLCSSTGAHLKCVAGMSRQARGSESVDFICDICQDVEKKILLSNQHRSMRTALDTDPTEEEQIDTSFYVAKTTHDPSVHSNSTAVPIFSDDENSEVSDVSVITVIASQERAKKLDLVEAPKKLEEEIIVLPDSQLTLQPDLESFSGLIMRQTVTKPAPAPDSPVRSNTGSVSVFSEEEQSQNIASQRYMTGMASQQTSSGATNEGEKVTLPLSSLEEIPDVQSHSQSDQESAPGLVIAKTFSCPGEPFFFVVVFTFDERWPERCTGSCTLRFADEDPRLKDRSLEVLQRLRITREDIWSRSTNRGVFGQIDLEK
ncbi:uncharacterized protein LOC117585527 [Drosophila guanche]|uniref:Blast:G2/M phase-specific E3 ubiquitin-protein ligase n=1 Tax=Drosophila guanche TaxID=7266 RepID=A0A3B0KE19_DROGU|nr:uncharacterized protein LOC117585527 [Drosophila guanche]SPP83271.1 blast:G2/M phase-specific E3 ubiquitin-protein ligase [Drosophila guanche]